MKIKLAILILILVSIACSNQPAPTPAPKSGVEPTVSTTREVCNTGGLGLTIRSGAGTQFLPVDGAIKEYYDGQMIEVLEIIETADTEYTWLLTPDGYVSSAYTCR